MRAKTLKDTGERLVPEFHKGHPLWGLVYAEHLTRYLCAEDLVENKTVLDIACGTGYGSQLLSKRAKKVYGVDNSEEAIKYARKNFSSKNTEYIIGSATEIPLEDKTVDVAVTFETIEHIEDHSKFLDEIKRVLKDDGIAIISTPNKREFAEGNHFHVHEFMHEELMTTVKKFFKNVNPYYQTTWKSVSISPAELIQKEGSINISTINLSPLEYEQSLYFYFICSNREIKEVVEPIAALGGQYSDKLILANQNASKQEMEATKDSLDSLKKTHEELLLQLDSIKNSHSYKLSRLLARIVKLIRFWS
jgi:ubiquinone/menaquinone biosynthesis C-methylase UbiE